MTDNDSLDYYKNQPAEAKLAVLRNEMITPISTIRGYATLMKKWRESDTSEVIPEDIDEFINRILDAGNRLRDVLEGITGIEKSGDDS